MENYPRNLVNSSLTIKHWFPAHALDWGNLSNFISHVSTENGALSLGLRENSSTSARVTSNFLNNNLSQFNSFQIKMPIAVG